MKTREVLIANRTYYVRTDGNDNNSGLSNDAAGALLTIQQAVDIVCDQIDNGGFDVVIQVADGAYNAGVVLRDYVGRGGMTLRGNTSTPSNVTITTTDVRCIQGFRISPWTIEGFSLSTTGTPASCIHANGCRFTVGTMVFRSSTLHHLSVARGDLFVTANYSISGGGVSHLTADILGSISGSAVNVTLTGTPAFSAAFVQAIHGSQIFWAPA